MSSAGGSRSRKANEAIERKWGQMVFIPLSPTSTVPFRLNWATEDKWCHQARNLPVSINLLDLTFYCALMTFFSDKNVEDEVDDIRRRDQTNRKSAEGELWNLARQLDNVKGFSPDFALRCTRWSHHSIQGTSSANDTSAGSGGKSGGKCEKILHFPCDFEIEKGETGKRDAASIWETFFPSTLDGDDSISIEVNSREQKTRKQGTKMLESARQKAQR